jgi:hypothetical protein
MWLKMRSNFLYFSGTRVRKRERRTSMSERVMLYSSYPATFEEFLSVIQAAGGNSASPIEEGYDLLGRIENGERHVLISGEKNPPDPDHFLKENLPFLGQELFEEIQAKLGAKPVRSFHISIGYAPKSGLLAVSFAYQFALCWPCIVYADVFEKEEWKVKVYGKEDIERLSNAGEAFTTYGMDEEE